MDNVDNNTFAEDEEFEEYGFEYNFINIPWDDRSNKSKINIVALLLAIFFATVACVINGFVIHYSGFRSALNCNNSKINCQMVKLEDYSYTVRIHSVMTQEVICVGALITNNAVMANGACIKSGAILLRLGSLYDPRCKKGFSINHVERIYHSGVISKKILILYSRANLGACARPIAFGKNINKNQQAYIIGRSSIQGGRSLSRQPVTVIASKGCICSGMATKNINNNENVICVKGLAQCPVLAGDLLVQNNRLFGLASTSVHGRYKHKETCFADLKIIYKSLISIGIPT